METKRVALSEVVSQEEWLGRRKALLEKEKELTRARDALNAERRRLPMVKIEKKYEFEGPKGRASLLDLFEGRRQLLVHHFMWHEQPDTFCHGCSAEADQNYNARFFKEMHQHDVIVVAVARAPFFRIKEEKGWDFPFYSSRDSDFSYDFQGTLKKGQNSNYNYQDASNLDGLQDYDGDLPGKSVFLYVGDQVFHTYSAYTRGLDQIATHYNYLDLTTYGRQESWEDSPEGWPKKPMH